MIDYDPTIQEALMPADTAMKFMIWASYYNGLELAPEVSFADMTRDGESLFGKTL